MAKKKLKLKVGDIVTYNAVGEKQYGKVKGICEDDNYAFVVFHCNNDWENWKDYTGQRTNVEALKKGWK